MIHVKGRDHEAIIIHRQVGDTFTFLLVREQSQDGSALREAYYREDFVVGDEPGELERAIAAAPVVRV